MHRFLFHFKRENRLINAFHYAMHGHHHKNPSDKNHMFMPPAPAFIFIMLFFGLFYLLMGNFTFYFLPGFEIGYLIYSLIHYSVHNHVASKGFMKYLWIHHAKHHYQTPEKAFGVSSTLWDFVFNTMPKNEKSTQKKTS
jgi:sterol desaturase/sphingolipid hydroxylase (fatty acid hydroxylase superfamily)